jgi:tetratricopeptide (TPR) repeat protein
MPALTAMRARLRDTDSPALWLAAVAVCRVAAVLSRSPRAWWRLGSARQHLGHTDRALLARHRAVTTPGAPPEWALRVGEEYEAAGDWEAAAEVYRSAAEQYPRRPVFQARLGRAAARQGHWSAAVEAYRRAVAIEHRPERRPELLARLGSAQAELGDLRSAASSYEEAARHGQPRCAWYERLGAMRERLGDHEGAMRAYLGAVELRDDSAAGRDARLALARLYEGRGWWALARPLLEENTVVHPGHGPSHRRLAEVAAAMWRWNGSLDPDDDSAGGGVLRSLEELGERADRSLDVACRAMERAVARDPVRGPWQARLGALRRDAGYLAGAVVAYERALAWASDTDARSAFRSSHAWEFALEHTHHLAGAPRVEDPLFDVTWDVVDAVQASRAPGCFRLDHTFGGVAITGFVTYPGLSRVEVWLDDAFLRSVEVAEGPLLRFGLDLLRDTLLRFPQRAVLRVRTPDGEELTAAGRGRALELRVPHGDASLAALTDAGARVDKKGTLRPLSAEVATRQEAHLRLYDRVRRAFDDALGRPLFALYGTLLGVHRDGSLIPGDDDFDAGYVSDRTDPVAVKEEAMELMLELLHEGLTVSFNRSGRLFRVHDEQRFGFDVHVDVHPVWFQDGHAWIHNHASFPCDVSAFLPVRSTRVDGIELYLPQRPEEFLRANYGPGWRVPDPDFAYQPAEVPAEVRATLTRALILPSEYRRLAEQVERQRSAGMGRLVSIGSGSMYPLDDFIP